ncbi:TWiK family of potassium channels protein 7 [Eurytemora carolleeae]|uniref:TWiK family of potassium channels protein 7 n=1 Tax=Eurytemora carolleeae TaxID=1294199 RepID=UPI000C76302C|nr:TWiK family of potassium channels protein 7 [Eurytemora carolleeae]|eukprot:XP_023329035.1 TWiK family of potassium channels protein 7-like [Eurytemora affinis]
METEKKKCRFSSFVKYLITNSFGLFVLLMLYVVGGAYLFIYLELPYETEQKNIMLDESDRMNASMVFIADYLAGLHHENKVDMDNCTTFLSSPYYSYHENYAKACPALAFEDPFCICIKELRSRYYAEAEDSLRKTIDQILFLTSEYGYEGPGTEWHDNWSVTNSMLFTLTTLTLIGYGHICPKTFMGKLMLILYSIFGLPLMMVFLANIGDFMADLTKRTYSRIACRMCRVRRRYSELEDKYTPSNKISNDIVGNEDYMPSDEINVPIIISLLFMGSYIVFGAYVFSVWEDWDFPSSCYFAFITLTTIGFGDYVPGSSFTGELTLNQFIKMTFTTLYCLMGLALISMGINLASEQIKIKVMWMAEQTGMAENEQTRKKYLIKKSKGVKETPVNKMGKRSWWIKKKPAMKVEDLDTLEEVDEGGDEIVDY